LTRVADTSALYALFSRADRFHSRAAKDVGDPDPIFIPTEILVETADLIAYRFTFSAAVQAVDFLLALPHVSLAERVEFNGVRDIHKGARGSLSLADAFVVQTCVSLGAKPLAYDRRIVEEVRRRRP
jgi:predicted nucleic acid-binding protein